MSKQTLPPVPRGFGSMTTGIAIVALGVAAIFFAFISNAPKDAKKSTNDAIDSTSAPLATPSPPTAYADDAGADLRLKSWSWHEEYSFAIAEGSVMNVSGRSLENVEAVVTFITSDGTFITSDKALIEFSPLLPGQTSPWKVTARWNPQMAKANVEFKTLRGERIGHYEIRRH